MKFKVSVRAIELWEPSLFSGTAYKTGPKPVRAGTLGRIQKAEKIENWKDKIIENWKDKIITLSQN